MNKLNNEIIMEAFKEARSFIVYRENVRLYANMYFTYPLFRNLSFEEKKDLFFSIIHKARGDYYTCSHKAYDMLRERGLDNVVYLNPIDGNGEENETNFSKHRELRKIKEYTHKNSNRVKFVEYEYNYLNPNNGSNRICINPHDLWRLDRFRDDTIN